MVCRQKGVQLFSTEVIDKEKFQKINSGIFLYLFPNMVRQVDYRWNQIYASMLLMYRKLVKFGVTRHDGKIIFEE